MATLTEVKNGVRIEKDFLGEKEVPNYAYYGVQTMRAVENFPITGYKIHEGLIKAFAIVKKAAALANTDVGRLELNKGGAIAEAAQEILDGKWHDHFIVDPIQGGAGTSMNMNANEVMANRALELLGMEKGDYHAQEILDGKWHDHFIVDPIQGGAGTSMNMNANEVMANRALELLGMEKGDYHYISPNSHVNMAQSTNDAFPTAIHIATLNALEGLLQTMGYMHDVFELKAEQFDHVIKMGRTHLQDAVPIRLGQEFKAYSRVLERDMKRIKQSRQHLYEVNMGATAVGTGLNADPEYIEAVVKHLATISELPLVGAEDLVDATQNTDA
ncbi:lyase family protein, partial [Bacillus cereus]|uniref:lyase family protein n=1 Tax=Bacillus cereus TaxID=1396 RepID=UPI003D6532C5